MADRRLYCDVSELTTTDRTRLQEVGHALAAARPRVGELPHGYTFIFGGDRATYQLVSEWLGYERRCCPFLDIELTSRSDSGPIVVSLTGTDGVKDVIRAELAGILGER